MSKKSPRGNYANSQESDAYHHRINTKLKMQRFIDRDGICCFGKYKSTPIQDIPRSYMEWACENISGFREEAAIHTSANLPEKIKRHRKYLVSPRCIDGKYYGFDELVRLWRVHPDECVNGGNSNTREQWRGRLIPLGPRKNGNYSKIPKSRQKP